MSNELYLEVTVQADVERSAEILSDLIDHIANIEEVSFVAAAMAGEEDDHEEHSITD